MNTWNFHKIPKVAHFYWGNEKISFLRYMSVVSFIKMNPDWKVKVHFPIKLGKLVPSWQSHEQRNVMIEEDYTSKLNSLNIEQVRHDFSHYGFDNAAHEVHKSDFLRWLLLKNEGGLWSDIDILYLKPMTALVENTEHNRNLDVGLVPYSGGGHTVGFLLSSGRNNPFYTFINDLAKKRFNPGAYEGIGATLINTTTPGIDTMSRMFPNTKFLFLDQKCVYSIMWYDTDKFFKNGEIPPSPNEAIGYHWYAGHPIAQEWDKKITEQNYKEFDSIICRGLGEILK